MCCPSLIFEHVTKISAGMPTLVAHNQVLFSATLALNLQVTTSDAAKLVGVKKRRTKDLSQPCIKGFILGPNRISEIACIFVCDVNVLNM